MCVRVARAPSPLRSLAGPGSAGFSACARPAGSPGPTRLATRQGCEGSGRPSAADPAWLQEELTVSVSRTRAGASPAEQGSVAGEARGWARVSVGTFPGGCAGCSQPSGLYGERPGKGVTFASGLAGPLVIFLSVNSLLPGSSAFWIGHHPTGQRHV